MRVDVVYDSAYEPGWRWVAHYDTRIVAASHKVYASRSGAFDAFERFAANAQWVVRRPSWRTES